MAINDFTESYTGHFIDTFYSQWFGNIQIYKTNDEEYPYRMDACALDGTKFAMKFASEDGDKLFERARQVKNSASEALVLRAVARLCQEFDPDLVFGYAKKFSDEPEAIERYLRDGKLTEDDSTG